MKNVYIAINKYNFGVAEVVAISEDAHVFGVTSSPVFGNGAIPAFNELYEEHKETFEEICGACNIIYIKDFNYSEDYQQVLKLYEKLNA